MPSGGRTALSTTYTLTHNHRTTLATHTGHPIFKWATHTSWHSRQQRHSSSHIYPCGSHNAAMARPVVRFYFDPISHNAMLAWFKVLKMAPIHGFTVKPVPTVFAGFLKAHHQLGPAEARTRRREDGAGTESHNKYQICTRAGEAEEPVDGEECLAQSGSHEVADPTSSSPSLQPPPCVACLLQGLGLSTCERVVRSDAACTAAARPCTAHVAVHAASVVSSIFRAVWMECGDAMDANVVACCVSRALADSDSAGDAGLAPRSITGSDVLDIRNDPEMKAQLLRNTELAIQRHAFGVPTMEVLLDGNDCEDATGEMFFGYDDLDFMAMYLNGEVSASGIPLQLVASSLLCLFTIQDPLNGLDLSGWEAVTGFHRRR